MRRRRSVRNVHTDPSSASGNAGSCTQLAMPLTPFVSFLPARLLSTTSSNNAKGAKREVAHSLWTPFANNISPSLPPSLPPSPSLSLSFTVIAGTTPKRGGSLPPKDRSKCQTTTEFTRTHRSRWKSCSNLTFRALFGARNHPVLEWLQRSTYWYHAPTNPHYGTLFPDKLSLPLLLHLHLLTCWQRSAQKSGKESFACHQVRRRVGVCPSFWRRGFGSKQALAASPAYHVIECC